MLLLGRTLYEPSLLQELEWITRDLDFIKFTFVKIETPMFLFFFLWNKEKEDFIDDNYVSNSEDEFSIYDVLKKKIL